MNILGIHIGHNASAFLLQDGAVIAGLSQEKCDDIKNSADFPADAIRAILNQAQLSTDGIDHVAIAGNQILPRRSYDYLFQNKPTDGHTRSGAVGLALKLEAIMPTALASIIFGPLRAHRHKQRLTQGRKELSQNLSDLGLGQTPCTYVDHHICHARAAYCSLGGTKPALIFTADGSGDGISATVIKVDDQGHWTRLGETPEHASIGGIYSATTRFLGMRPLEHEYKVMGLAPYAKSYADDIYERAFAKTIQVSPNNPYCFESTVDSRKFYDHLAKTAVGERFDNIAAAAQRLIEEQTVQWVERSVAESGVHHAYFGGGLFMNVKLNKRIQELDCLNSAHFMPSCGDESNALGAAYDVALEMGPVQPLKNLYVGLSYSPEEIEGHLKEYGLNYTRPDNLNETIADLLADGQVVARFADGNEWGARSLGNRAILAHPGRMESFFTVNDQIKCRDFWMPFAPSVLDTAADKYLENWTMERTPAPFMITAFQSTELGRKELTAALHRGDGTLRPQVLTPEANADYYDLIQRFEAKTGIGAVLNTSLNRHGKPLAATPVQALDTLVNSGLRHLAIGPFLVSKD
ncbi:MAG: hypothetical protein OQK24_09120 [Magnetovibrio sp.]|nr:hypothetical protein [Magnetovibrio sp.]